MEWKHTGKEKVLGTAVSKEGHADSILGFEFSVFLLDLLPYQD